MQVLPIRNFLCAALIGAAFPAFGAHAATFETVHQFEGLTDGSIPVYGLALGPSGILYGTTAGGGSYQGKHCGGGCGTIFSVDPATGKFTSLHKFRESIDGLEPNGPLVSDAQGKLYGATGGPGFTSGGGGTIFELDPATNRVKTLYTMPGSGSTAPTCPITGLTWVQGAVYGGTFCGGPTNQGAIYKFDLTAKTFTIVQPLGGKIGDSMGGSMVVGKDGMIYGTTQALGAKHDGTLFKIDPANGHIVLLHAFSQAEGGSVSNQLAIANDGTIFGVNAQGSTNRNCDGSGCGTIFKFDPATAKLTALHIFTGGADGGIPAGVTMSKNGNFLYGQTNYGGAHGQGTVFRFNTATNKLVTLHAFDGPDGAMADFTRTNMAIGKDGTLFGVAPAGGVTNTPRCKPYGCGTAFQIKP